MVCLSPLDVQGGVQQHAVITFPIIEPECKGYNDWLKNVRAAHWIKCKQLTNRILQLFIKSELIELLD